MIYKSHYSYQNNDYNLLGTDVRSDTWYGRFKNRVVQLLDKEVMKVGLMETFKLSSFFVASHFIYHNGFLKGVDALCGEDIALYLEALFPAVQFAGLHLVAPGSWKENVKSMVKGIACACVGMATAATLGLAPLAISHFFLPTYFKLITQLYVLSVIYATFCAHNASLVGVKEAFSHLKWGILVSYTITTLMENGHFAAYVMGWQAMNISIYGSVSWFTAGIATLSSGMPAYPTFIPRLSLPVLIREIATIFPIALDFSYMRLKREKFA